MSGRIGGDESANEARSEGEEAGGGATRMVPFYGPERLALIERGWMTVEVDGALDERTATRGKVRPIRPNAIPKEGSK